MNCKRSWLAIHCCVSKVGTKGESCIGFVTTDLEMLTIKKRTADVIARYGNATITRVDCCFRRWNGRLVRRIDGGSSVQIGSARDQVDDVPLQTRQRSIRVQVYILDDSRDGTTDCSGACLFAFGKVACEGRSDGDDPGRLQITSSQPTTESVYCAPRMPRWYRAMQRMKSASV